MTHVAQYFQDALAILRAIEQSDVEKMIALILKVREQHGRIFFIGVGGSAANCSHAVNDFRKIAQIEAYTPVDNVAELTARTNDEGWHTVFAGWLKGSSLQKRDGVFVFSVGGGNKEKNVSANIVHALEYAQEVGAKIFGVVSRDGGYTAKVADACVIIPPLNPTMVTPHAESFQAFIWHLIVTDPRIMQISNKWESLQSK
ncbi:MAG: SIS domain-containing protein [bacterium]|nr:SIS domain-containing protein [bacterium]